MRIRRLQLTDRTGYGPDVHFRAVSSDVLKVSVFEAGGVFQASPYHPV